VDRIRLFLVLGGRGRLIAGALLRGGLARLVGLGLLSGHRGGVRLPDIIPARLAHLMKHEGHEEGEDHRCGEAGEDLPMLADEGEGEGQHLAFSG
jgi:hypothetical protein